MNRALFVTFLVLIFNVQLVGQDVVLPAQPEEGPGGMEYPFGEVTFHDFADKPDGYWLFEPRDPVPDSARVVVFLHGYGGYNPMIYGAWIRHLVRRGNIVIYPRYQRNVVFPRPNKFADNVATAIRDARQELETGDHVQPIWDNIAYVGHSYGGVIISDLAINWQSYGIPKPEGAMICSSGTAMFKGGLLEDYSSMPADLKLIIFVSENDGVVGDEFSLKVFEEATMTLNRVLLRQYSDDYGDVPIKDGHRQPYALDTTFDTGVRNYTARKALRVSTLDPVDYNGYWKVFDSLLDCIRMEENCHTALCGCSDQAHLGYWSDGTQIKPLEIEKPVEEASPPELEEGEN